MAKIPTSWTPQPSGTVTTDNASVKRLDQLDLLRIDQNGVIRILQPNVISEKEATTWSKASALNPIQDEFGNDILDENGQIIYDDDTVDPLNATSWIPQPSGTVLTISLAKRLDQSGITRIDEAKVNRLAQPNVISKKSITAWSEE